jgi:SAM-dependent methyltransferase
VDTEKLTAEAAVNRERWDEQSDEYQARHGAQLEESGGTAWGVWQIPESELGVLGDVSGLDVLELGCGAAQWSIALSRQGARMTALDNSSRQLEHARQAMAAARVEFPLVHAGAESTGLPDSTFDVVFCDFGAMTFSDPHNSVPEVARLLRPGGLFAFSALTPIAELAWALGEEGPGESLVVDYWEGKHGFAIEDLIELRPAADAVSSYRTEKDREWARRWPMEHIWRVRLQAARGD